jgi:hypothetical protein
MVVVLIIVALWFFRRGEGYDIKEMKRAVAEFRVSTLDENIIGPILEKGAGNQTGEELNTLKQIMDKYPGLGQKIEAIARSPSPSVNNVVMAAAKKAEPAVPIIPAGLQCKFTY